eukprot:CAMPEP_0119472826 /NCGR_PEP_ID=MMETSP1344-20130328/4735_1 /TAXON_ID=236787 /ORGANISM="Florenciella parvula, Strain CCMP2471" /LENGTH=90 /DNA_ID=CAMNT_0007505847 /DNA_START=104 /DNA_END=376 /DNA_ORIENTATION=-
MEVSGVRGLREHDLMEHEMDFGSPRDASVIGLIGCGVASSLDCGWRRSRVSWVPISSPTRILTPQDAVHDVKEAPDTVTVDPVRYMAPPY